MNGLGTEQAADMVGAERRLGAFHFSLLSTSQSRKLGPGSAVQNFVLHRARDTRGNGVAKSRYFFAFSYG
jgi:hypothetical protein